MKISITFKDISSYLEKELADHYPSFELSFLTKLNINGSLMRMSLPSVQDYSTALQQTITEHKFKLSATLASLIEKYTAMSSTFVIPNKATITQTHKPTAKITNTVKRSSPKTNDSTFVISTKKMKLVRKSLNQKISSSEKLYSSCKVVSCQTCLQIFKRSPLTQCSHVAPHDAGYYPHVSRKVLRKIHQTLDYMILSSLPGISNPLKEPPPLDTGRSAIMDSENTMEIRSRTSSVSTSASKRPRIVEEFNWDWVRENLDSRPDKRAYQMLVTRLRSMPTLPPPEVMRLVSSYQPT